MAVQVGHLGLGDLGDLSLGDGSDLVLVGDTGTALQAAGLHDQQGSRRRLGDEGEAAVSVIVSMFGRETPVEFELDQVEPISQ